MTMHVPNAYRVRAGRFGSDDSEGNNGKFFVPNKLAMREKINPPLCCVASDGNEVGAPDIAQGWQHVSVSLPHRCPTWAEMDYVKGLFWDDTDAVMQLHPPRESWVNNHPTCLHLWRPVHVQIPLPDALLVGIPGLKPREARAVALAAYGR
jgi:hypothetical protein